GAGLRAIHLWRGPIGLRYAALVLLLVVAALPIRSEVAHISDVGERRLSEAFSVSARHAAQGYWQGYADSRNLIDEHGRAIVAAIRQEQRAGRLGSDGRILHLAEGPYEWQGIPIGVFTGALETSVSPTPDTSLHAPAGRQLSLEQFQPALESGDYAYVVVEPKAVPQGLVAAVKQSGYEPLMENELATLFRRNPDHRAAAGPDNRVRLELVADGLDRPTGIEHAGDGSGRLFIPEQSGAVRILAGGAILDAPFLDLSDRVAGGFEQGLLGLAFHPEFASNGRFFVHYTDENGDTVVAEFAQSADGERADPDSERVLLTVDQPNEFHNGGGLEFGPDGYLYIGLGDGGGIENQPNSQRLDTLLGKLLRIDVDTPDEYGVPDSNPFVSRSEARPEIWALGLRNPWRLSFDSRSGDLYIADVGELHWEEINRQPANSEGGENYGWDVMEGNHCLNADVCERDGLTLPIIEYGRDDGSCAVIGGHVLHVDDPSIGGMYIYGDFCSGRIWGARTDALESPPTELLDTDYQPTSFGVDEDGGAYMASHDGLLFAVHYGAADR
ncbi:MAG TPA: PQQ-dependent sugar dehydrogenase, partial [Thermomicrobiales bacterium]|nr:PQQ-dependent sugar dehydrogenase [Thermomicrobiales bacterium]